MQAEVKRGAGLLLALLLYQAAISGGYLYATLGSGAWPWPFSRAPDAHAAALRLAAYIPVLICSMVALAFVPASGERVARLYTGRRPDGRAMLVLAACVGYASYMLARHRAPFAAPDAWPALVALSAMNAFAEETLYRGVFPVVVARASPSALVRRALPALAYAAPHLAISLPLTAFALGLGLALGWVREGRGGLWACVVCHFVADLGAIGLPFLPDAGPR